MKITSRHLAPALAASVLLAALAAGLFLFADTAPFAGDPRPGDEESVLARTDTASGSSGDYAPDRLRETARPKGAFNRPRYEYFFRLLRDPVTDAIPSDVRARELDFARSLPRAAELPREGAQPAGFNWSNAGPTDVGGRTRALGIDRRNPDILIAGGVSGGIWKSTDGGATWDLKTPAAENLSVTDLVQHPNQPDTWYYVSGEISGNSASGSGAFYYGSGVYRSTDNGETWNRITSNTDDPTVVDDPFDIMSRVDVNPATGSLFICSNGFGVYRAPDGQNFENQAVLGNPVSMMHCDLEVTSTGTLFAALSTEKIVDNANTPQQTGLFMSTDDGETWTNITPSEFPEEHGRSVLASAPSDEDILYVLTENLSSEDNQGVAFYRIDMNENLVSDRSANLPDFRSGDDGSGYMNLQGGYNMVVAVKPDDPNFVLVGGTNLYRSTDGFATAPSGGYDIDDQSQVDRYWIGGYQNDNSFSIYPGQHPDQHIMVFHPDDPDRMYAGTDGGVSLTQDVTATEVTWTYRNTGYVTSQFYTSAIPSETGDNRLMGGTQDNGTPYFQYPGGGSQITSEDISLGDGGYAYFTLDYLYVSRQRGSIVKYTTNSTGEPTRFDCVHPSGVDREQVLFIHPYTVDPNDQNVMYFPDQNRLWRNTRVGEIDNNNPSCPGASLGWNVLHEAAVPHGYTISALEVSRKPGNTLFYAASSTDQTPLLWRLNNAKNGSPSPVDISIPGAPSGAWVKDLALNPVSGGPGDIEILAVMSNYNITGLWHSNDSGQTWEAVEGNLTGSSGGNNGPSLRGAAILPTKEGPVYLVATSIGLYRTHTLDGSNTVWGQEAEAEIGNAVTDYVALRVADGDVAAGTHGRGMLHGDFLGSTDVPTIAVSPGSGRVGEEVTISATDFTFSEQAADNEVFFNDARADVLQANPQQLLVRVPRAVLPREAENRSATVRVTTDNQTFSTTFEVLPPQQNSLSQNFPNPFDGTTRIPLDLQQESRVTLRVFNVLGQEVFVPHEGDLFKAGTYNIPIDFGDKASGIYLFHVIADPVGGGPRYIDSRTMTLVK